MQLLSLFLAQGLSQESLLLPQHTDSLIWTLGAAALDDSEESAGRLEKKAVIGIDVFISFVFFIQWSGVQYTNC